jgi:DNA-binding HxlR family transcriptional regulator
MKIRNEYTCPLEIVHDIVKGKWKPIIIFQLRNGAVTLADLERQIQGINQKMLIEQLKELTEYGIVERTKYKGYPLRVEYSLTYERGKKMLDAVLIMQSIGIDYMKENGMTDILKCKDRA